MRKVVARSTFVVLAGLAGWGASSVVAHADPMPGPAPAPGAPAPAAAPAPSPYLNPYGSGTPGGSIYGETSPYAGGQAPGVSSPQPGVVPGYVAGALGPLTNEISTGSSGIRPGTNAILPGYVKGLPVPDFPENRIKAPEEKLPGLPPGATPGSLPGVLPVNHPPEDLPENPSEELPGN